MVRRPVYVVLAMLNPSQGDFIYMTVLGQPIYVISSFNTATELMDKRALIYSDRPIMIMAQELSVFIQPLTSQFLTPTE